MRRRAFTPLALVGVAAVLALAPTAQAQFRFNPSDNQPVASSFTTSQSAGATSNPIRMPPGVPVVVSVWSSATPGAALGAPVYLACSVDGGVTYLPQTAGGTQLETFTTTTQDQWSTKTGALCELVLNGTPTQTINYRLDP